MNNEKIIPASEIPIGLGMAFAQNTDAMKVFTSLSPEGQRALVEKARSVKSKEDMQALVSSLGAKR